MNGSADENRAETHTAELASFSWTQSHSNADRCFNISFGKAECDSLAGHYLNCEFISDSGDIVECCDVPVDDEMWRALEALVHTLQLPAYSAPDPYLMDATDSRIRMTRRENGGRITDVYNGEYAHELFSEITKLAIEISIQHKENADD